MKDTKFNADIERMKELINCKPDGELRNNTSETVEYTVNAADGKTYGIVRECKKYFIKEQNEKGEYEYIGGIGNKSENEYSGYNSAFRNIELKIRSINESKNNGKVFETFKPVQQAEYIVEDTENMRKELNRLKEISNNSSGIMKEAKTEFITKPIFKDKETVATATNFKKLGDPFDVEPGEYKGDIDPATSTKTAKNAGEPFNTDAKACPEKMDIEKTNKKPCEAGNFGEPAKNVPANSVTNQKPKGGKVIKVTEAQLKAVRKALKESYYEDDEEDPLLKQFSYPEIDNLGRGDKPVGATRTDVDAEFPNGEEDEKSEYPEIEEESDQHEMDEGFFDNMKAAAGTGKFIGNKLANGIKQTGQNAKTAFGDLQRNLKDAGSDLKQGFKDVTANTVDRTKQAGQAISQQYNKGLQNSSTEKIEKIASQLRSELENLNARTIKAGGSPINIKSVVSALANQIAGRRDISASKFRSESIDEDMVNKITEDVLNAFGKHSTYQKPAFTTPSDSEQLVAGTRDTDDESVKGNAPYGQKIGKSDPFTEPVSQKIGEGEIGTETKQGLPKLGEKGDEQPFDNSVKSDGDEIAKGDEQPFDKEAVIKKVTESVLAQLKKK
jgi:hypothetical protein